jgi:hypothetical protein
MSQNVTECRKKVFVKVLDISLPDRPKDMDGTVFFRRKMDGFTLMML